MKQLVEGKPGFPLDTEQTWGGDRRTRRGNETIADQTQQSKTTNSWFFQLLLLFWQRDAQDSAVLPPSVWTLTKTWTRTLTERRRVAWSCMRTSNTPSQRFHTWVNHLASRDGRVFSEEDYSALFSLFCWCLDRFHLMIIKVLSWNVSSSDESFLISNYFISTDEH